MSRAVLWAATAAVTCGLGAAAFLTFAQTTAQTQPSAADIAAGTVIYAETCASCHGEDLEGQPDWQSVLDDGTRPAPPHDPSGHTWHHGDGMLFAYTKFGGQRYADKRGIAGFKSGMPGFEDELSDQEIRNVLAYIKSTWPDEVRAVQQERTANE